MSESKTIRLDDACNVEYGTRVVQKRDGGSIYPVYGGGGATFNLDAFNREDRLVVARFGMSEECARFVSGKFFLNDSGLTVSPRNGDMYQRFLDYQILSKNDEIFALGKGSAQKNLDVPAFRELPLYVPADAAEQQRIVSLLDEAFSGIATAKANAEINLQNARAIFDSHLQALFAQRGEGWIERAVAECFKVRSGDFLPAKAMQESGDVDVYGGNGIAGKHDESNLAGDNILIGRVGAKCGNVRRVQGKVWVTDNAFFVSEYFHAFDLGFLARALTRQELRSTANQAAQPVISYTTIKDVVLAFPISIGDQARIADDLNMLEAETKRLESVYQRKLVALDALKKSLLHQAFAGAL